MFRQIKDNINNTAMFVWNELIAISTNYAVLVVLIGGVFGYGLLYNYMYAPNLIRKAPVAVVDNSHSELSRKFIRYMNSSSQVDIVATDVSYPAAIDMMDQNKAIGVLYIPSDFDNRVSQGQQSIFVLYESTTVFLSFMALQETAASCMLAINDFYRPEMLVFLESSKAMDLTSAQPINVEGTALYNHTEGYGSYLIPAVLFVIIFQTLMMIIAMISGEERNTGSILKYAGDPANLGFRRMAQVVFGKSIAYLIIYALLCVFFLGFIPVLFDLPRIGNILDIIILFVPYILASSFFGLTLSFMYSDGDAPIVMIAFFSVGLIFLSGVSYPLELQPWYWRCAHFIIPAGPGTLGYVMINSMGSSINEIAIEYIALLIQCFVYFITACFVLRFNIRKAMQRKAITATPVSAHPQADF